MMGEVSISFEAIAVIVSKALLHTLWQGAILALLLAAVFMLVSTTRARVRYGLACLALALLPVMMAVNVAVSLPNTPPISGTGEDYAAATAEPGVNAGETGTGMERSAPGETIRTFDTDVPPLSFWAFVFWAAGMFALTMYRLAGWFHARWFVRQGILPPEPEWQQRFNELCCRLRVSRPVQLLQSTIVKAPCVIGWVRPVVLMPVSAFTGLDDREIVALLAHELAHVRRWDVLVNYLQMATETLLFFNPAAWWISRQITVEREHCCDDIAVAACADRACYIRALTGLEQLRRAEPSLALAAAGGSLLRRVRRLLEVPMHKTPLPRVGPSGVMALSGAIFALALLATGALTTQPAMADPDQDEVETVESVEPEKDDVEGRWDIEWAGRGRLQLDMRFARRHRCAIRLDEEEFVGLDYVSDARFELRREAGTFYFEGDFEHDDDEIWGDGTVVFRADEAYIEALKSIGVRVQSNREVLTLAIHDVSLDFIEGLHGLGYDRISTDELTSLHIHDVDPEYIKTLAALGYPDLDLDRMVEMRIHDVDPDYIRSFVELGLVDIPASRLVEMSIHDVTPALVAEMKELGYDHLSPSRLVEMSIHDVSPRYLRDMAESGYRHVSPSRLVEMRIHGVEPSWVRDLAELGYDDINPSKLVEMRIHDVETDDIRRFQDLGLKDLSPSRLVEFAIHDVTPYFVSELAELGYKDVSPSRLVEMKIHNVTPEFIRRLQRRGYDDLSPSELVEYRIHGVPRSHRR